MVKSKKINIGMIILISIIVLEIISDIFYIQSSGLVKIERMGEKSTNNVINAINQSKKTNLWRFIHGLGIRNIGENASKILAQKFKIIEKLSVIKQPSFVNISTV